MMDINPGRLKKETSTASFIDVCTKERRKTLKWPLRNAYSVDEDFALLHQDRFRRNS